MTIPITVLYLLTAIALDRVGASPLTSPTAHPSGVDKNVIVQLFEWDWESVGEECTQFIGPAGYGYVQVSPPAEHIQGEQWWTDYQPVSYKISSKRGDRNQLQQMVAKCHTAGVKVITDTVLNHMSAMSSGTGTDGSSFTKYNYPGLYSNDDFHRNCGTPDNTISNFSNRNQLQNCELLGLSDLATGSEHVQARLVDYVIDLRSLDVDGFRLDAAKHIPSNDIHNILSKVPGFGTPSFYVTQEVVGGTNSDDSEVKATEYLKNGDVQVFEYSEAIKDAFIGGNVAGLKDLGHDWIPSANANVFVVNHDKERNGEALNANSPSNTYILGHVFSLAHPYGHISVLSSYEEGLRNKDAGGPSNGKAKCTGSGRDGNDGWLCQHRWTAIAGMTRFRNAVQDAALENWESPQQDRVAFSRGKAGFVAINNSDSPWSATLQTGLPKGNYCDVVSGGAEGGGCTGTTIDVSADGKLSTTIPARSAVGIHVGEVKVGGVGRHGELAPAHGKENANALKLGTLGVMSGKVIGSVTGLVSREP